MDKKESDAAEMELANLIVSNAEDTPIMMGSTKPMVITGVVKVKIAKPDFDITKHKWSDEPITYLDNDASGVELRATESAWFVNFYIDKSDAIALAKHFKLTEADLNA